MMNRITLILFSVFMGFVFGVFAQNDNKKPEWAKDSYRKELKNSYLETIVVTTEVTTDAMRRKAREMLVERRRLTTGERVIFNEEETQSQVGLTVYSKPLYEYIDYEKEIGYFLFQTLKKTNLEYEPIEYTDKYPFSARVFVPGMAQIHKGSTGKGVGFIIGEVALIGGIVTCEGLRASYESKITSTRNTVERQQYIDNASNMELARNICIAGAAAVYVWNIIDGCVAKGKKHIRVVPYVSYSTKGITATFNF